MIEMEIVIAPAGGQRQADDHTAGVTFDGHPLARAQQPQARAGEGGGAEPDDGPIIEKYASRPGCGVEAADCGLHDRVSSRCRRGGDGGSQRSPGRLRSAVWMIRFHSCAGGSPVASHMSGNADADVIPGMVLISLRMIRPSGV